MGSKTQRHSIHTVISWTPVKNHNPKMVRKMRWKLDLDGFILCLFLFVLFLTSIPTVRSWSFFLISSPFSCPWLIHKTSAPFPRQSTSKRSKTRSFSLAFSVAKLEIWTKTQKPRVNHPHSMSISISQPKT